MTETILCLCGNPLVDEVTEEGVRPVGGDEVIRFRRSTDYVICESCLRTYSARDLIARSNDAKVIDLLELIALRIESQ